MNVRVIRSNRKTVSIRVNEDYSVTVRAPRRATDRDIERIIREREAWIVKTVTKMQKQQAAAGDVEPLSNEEVRELARQAVKYIPERVKLFADLVGVKYGHITIRNQKTRWGSCSSKGNLNFNCLLMLAPSEVIDYVVVHELCHILQMNHSKAFWDEVARVMPEYKTHVKWLKTEGSAIMRRMYS